MTGWSALAVGGFLGVIVLAGGVAAKIDRCRAAEPPVPPPRERYLLLDDRVVERRENAVLRLGAVRKHPSNPLFGEEHPWEARLDNVYPNVVFDAEKGLYRIWYKTFTRDAVTEDGTPVPREQRVRGTYSQFPRKRGDGLCYAESKDGLTWEKPLLDLNLWEGAPTNLVTVGDHGVGVFIDLHDPRPEQRYKMLLRRSSRMAVRFSADGLRWSDVVFCPEIAAAGDTHNNALWSLERQAYVGITRLFSASPRQRVVGRSESRDFVHWTPAKEVLRGEESAQVYSMPVFRYADVYLGLPAIFRSPSHGGDDRVHTELAWSTDTLHWHRIEPGAPFIPCSETEGDYDWGCVFASVPVVRGGEIRIYYGASNGLHTDWRDSFLALATLRPDGFAGYRQEDDSQPAVLVTRPVALTGGCVRITADVDEGGSVTAALLDRAGNELVRGRPIAKSVTDGIAAELAPREGQIVRVRLEFERAQVYSVSFAAAPAGS